MAEITMSHINHGSLEGMLLDAAIKFMISYHMPTANDVLQYLFDKVEKVHGKQPLINS